jgi:hypothetical protein
LNSGSKIQPNCQYTRNSKFYGINGGTIGGIGAGKGAENDIQIGGIIGPPRISTANIKLMYNW